MSNEESPLQYIIYAFGNGKHTYYTFSTNMFSFMHLRNVQNCMILKVPLQWIKAGHWRSVECLPCNIQKPFQCCPQLHKFVQEICVLSDLSLAH